jgi:hypothetical protein
VITRIEKILSLLQAEGINPHNEWMAIKSLSETVMPKQNIAVYKEWLSDKANTTATSKY